MDRAPSRIVMVGTSFATRGGISSVVNSLRGAGLFSRWPIEYIESHCDGSVPRKLYWAAKGLARFAVALVRYPRAVLHVHTASRASFWRKLVFITLARAAGWPYIVHLHGGGFARFHAEAAGWQRRLIESALSHAACVITVSERWSAWIRETVPAARVACVPNPALVRACRAVREPGLIAFVGRCEAAKGIFDLLEALRTNCAWHPEARLECAGDGDLQAVADHAEALGIRSRVNLRGWIDVEERSRLLARATVFVLPSHAEGLPVSLLEAMGAGCAVIASDAGGIPDAIVNGGNGLLVPAGDVAALAAALDHVLRDALLASRLGSAARATVTRNHGPGLAVARLASIYSEVI